MPDTCSLSRLPAIGQARIIKASGGPGGTWHAGGRILKSAVRLVVAAVEGPPKLLKDIVRPVFSTACRI